MSPEIKERVLAKVTELIKSCCEDDVCVCPDDRERGPIDDDGEQDLIYEITRDRRYFDE